MPAAVRFVVSGVRSIDRKLKLLPLRTQKREMDRAIRVGLKLVQAEIRTIAPRDTGATRRAVQVRALKKSTREARQKVSDEVRIAASRPGLKKASARTGKSYFYPAIIEYKYYDFMHIAYRNARGPALRAAIGALKAGVQRQIEALKR
jgi:hypothetical protein